MSLNSLWKYVESPLPKVVWFLDRMCDVVVKARVYVDGSRARGSYVTGRIELEKGPLFAMKGTLRHEVGHMVIEALHMDEKWKKLAGNKAAGKIEEDVVDVVLPACIRAFKENGIL